MAYLNRKGQLHMTETIAVMFIFFVLIMFAMIFYYKYQQIAFKEKQDELLAARAMDKTLKALFLPELLCTKGDAEAEDNCFDLMKLRHANETFVKYLTNYYFNVFSYARISVEQLYPEKKEFVLYDKLKPDATGAEKTYFVVILKDEVRGEGLPQYNFGYVMVEVYQ
jgi:hypothetical protein